MGWIVASQISAIHTCRRLSMLLRSLNRCTARLELARALVMHQHTNPLCFRQCCAPSQLMNPCQHLPCFTSFQSDECVAAGLGSCEVDDS